MMRAAGSDGVRNVDHVLPPSPRREQTPKRRAPTGERRDPGDEPDDEPEDDDATEPSIPREERPRIDVRV